MNEQIKDGGKHMKEQIKELTVGAKKSRNFQTYECAMSISIPIDASVEEVVVIRRKYQSICRKAVVDEINLDRK